MGGLGGCYQPGVYVPLKALFLVFSTEIVQFFFFLNPKGQGDLRPDFGLMHW